MGYKDLNLSDCPYNYDLNLVGLSSVSSNLEGARRPKSMQNCWAMAFLVIAAYLQR